MCGRACHCIHLAHLHEWDFSIPPLPRKNTSRKLRVCKGKLQLEILYATSSVTKMLTELDWKTLEERRMKDRMIMTCKICNDLVGIDAERHFNTTRAENMHVETRNKTKVNLMQIFSVKGVYKYSFIPRASREWNQLTTEAKRDQIIGSLQESHQRYHASQVIQ